MYAYESSVWTKTPMLHLYLHSLTCGFHKSASSSTSRQPPVSTMPDCSTHPLPCWRWWPACSSPPTPPPWPHSCAAAAGGHRRVPHQSGPELVACGSRQRRGRPNPWPKCPRRPWRSAVQCRAAQGGARRACSECTSTVARSARRRPVRGGAVSNRAGELRKGRTGRGASWGSVLGAERRQGMAGDARRRSGRSSGRLQWQHAAQHGPLPGAEHNDGPVDVFALESP